MQSEHHIYSWISGSLLHRPIRAQQLVSTTNTFSFILFLSHASQCLHVFSFANAIPILQSQLPITYAVLGTCGQEEIKSKDYFLLKIAVLNNSNNPISTTPNICTICRFNFIDHVSHLGSHAFIRRNYLLDGQWLRSKWRNLFL